MKTKRKMKHVGRVMLIKEMVDLLSLPEGNKTLGYFTRSQLVELKIKVSALICKADQQHTR